MQLISKVAKKTNISVNTIRAWCNGGKLGQHAELRDLETGKAWYTSVNAVTAYQKSHKLGRPPKNKP